MTSPTPRSHVVGGRGRSPQRSENSTMLPDVGARIAPRGVMSWERISGNWAHWKGRVRERWGRLTDDQLIVVAGRREQLSGRIQEAYGISREDADRQLRNWERNLSVGESTDPDDEDGDTSRLAHRP